MNLPTEAIFSEFLIFMGCVQGRLRWGAGGAAATSAFIHGGAGGARISLHAELFSSLLSSERAFSCIADSLVFENFS